ncbi:unnamed protein product [Prunus armeniaca]
MSGRYDGMRAGENVARPSGEVARVFGLAGVLTDPIQGRVRPVEPGLIGKSYVWLDPLVEILGNVQFTWETLPKFRQKVSCPKSSLVKEDIVLRSKPGVGVMPGSPQGSSRVPGNSGRGPVSLVSELRFNFLWTLHLVCILKLWEHDGFRHRTSSF